MAAVLKTATGASLSWVRIPRPPLADSSDDAASGAAGLSHYGTEGALGGGGSTRVAAGSAQDPRDTHRDSGAEQWADDVHPVRREVAVGQIRTEGPSRVHGR